MSDAPSTGSSESDSLYNALLANFADGLEAQGLDDGPAVEATPLGLLDWSTGHRVINGQPFSVPPALEEIYRSQDRYVTVRKAAQVAISEWMINVAFWVADTRQGQRGNSLYVFPKQAQLNDFSRARIEKAINESPYLQKRQGTVANVGLRQMGPGYVYFRGAQNREQLLSVDADLLCLDEVAQYQPGTITTALKRLGSSLLGWVRTGSTPRYPSDEAAVLWDQSSQHRYHVRCSRCGSWEQLMVETHLEPRTGVVRCTRCRGDMTRDRLGRGEWVATHTGREWTGYQLNKLLSPRANLPDIAAMLGRIEDGRATPFEVQEFKNSDCGLPHLPAGGSVSPEDLDACQTDPDYVACPTHLPPGRTGYMGVDVGVRLHVRVDTLEEDGRARLVYADSVRTFEELDPLLERYRVARCVIDGNPETRSAQALAARHPRRVLLAYYPNFGDTRRTALYDEDRRAGTVQINRTIALDAVQARIHHRALVLPREGRALGGDVDKGGSGEYYRHLGSPIRVLGQNKATGNPEPHYEQNGPDHFAHAEVYALVAAQGRPAGGVGGVPGARVAATPAAADPYRQFLRFAEEVRSAVALADAAPPAGAPAVAAPAGPAVGAAGGSPLPAFLRRRP